MTRNRMSVSRCCCQGRCANCTGLDRPEMTVTISGFTAGTVCNSQQCAAEYDGVYVLGQTYWLSDWCQYHYSGGPTQCSYAGQTWELRGYFLKVGSDYLLRVDLRDIMPGPFPFVAYRWEKNFGTTRPPCRLTDESVPHTYTVGNAGCTPPASITVSTG